jgi:tetratricopeptide (TPR) repeat protein
MDNPGSRKLLSTLAIAVCVVGPVLAALITATLAQAPKQKDAEPAAKPPWQRLLKGDDAKRAAELKEAIDGALRSDRWAEAIARADELRTFRSRVQGAKHYETVTDEWRLKALRRVAPLPTKDHIDYLQASLICELAKPCAERGELTQPRTLYEWALATLRRLLTDDHPQTAESYDLLAIRLKSCSRDELRETAERYKDLGIDLGAQGICAALQPLFEKALHIRQGLLTDDHPQTAESYNNVAANLGSQAKYVQAQPLFVKALEIRGGLFSNDRLNGVSANNLAANLNDQGKYAEAQPLLETGLEIFRVIRTDDHPDTAMCYNNLAANLDAQGRHAEAEPLHRTALETFRRHLGDKHPWTTNSLNNMAANLDFQGKYAQAQPHYEKALEINRGHHTDDSLLTATSYNSLGVNLHDQGKYVEALPFCEKALKIRRSLMGDDYPETAASYSNVASNRDILGDYIRAEPQHKAALAIFRLLLSDDHPRTAATHSALAYNLVSQGKYEQARDEWLIAVKGLDKARLLVAFAGIERAGAVQSPRAPLSAIQARLGQTAEAWQTLEENFARGLLDELAARKDERLTQAERARLHELITEFDRLEELMEMIPKELGKAERAKRFDGVKNLRAQASIALGEFQTKLVGAHGELAGRVATLGEIQAALPADAALIAWVDVAPVGPKAADLDGEHWGVVVRPRGGVTWVPIAGTGRDGLWSEDDAKLASRVGAELRKRHDDDLTGLRPLIERLRNQRLAPLAKALGASDGLLAARRLIVLPSREMAGIPVEALLAKDDSRTVSYAPSGTVFKHLREQPRPDRGAGLLAVGAAIYVRPEKSSEPEPPDHGLLLRAVVPGSNAAARGLKRGDVLLAYNGIKLLKAEDLKPVGEPGRLVPVDVWRRGKVDRLELAPGKPDVVFDPKPAPVAIMDERKLGQALAAVRSGTEEFGPLQHTRHEVEALAQLFRIAGRPARPLIGPDASEPELDRLAATGELGRFDVIHLATHAVIDEGVPARSAVILTQTGLPDAYQQVLNNKPPFDGRLSVREIQHGWRLKADLVTLSACETALGRDAGGEGFVGFTQALLISGSRSVCLSLWKVNDLATSLLMKRFYQNWLGKREGLGTSLAKAEALREAKQWLRELTDENIDREHADVARGPNGAGPRAARPAKAHPFEHPYYWAGFILVGDPD